MAFAFYLILVLIIGLDSVLKSISIKIFHFLSRSLSFILDRHLALSLLVRLQHLEFLPGWVLLLLNRDLGQRLLSSRMPVIVLFI